MNKADAVFALLSADSALATTLTGGVYLIQDVPYHISLDSMPAIYDSASMVMKPWATVRGREVLPLPNAPRDRPAQLQTQRQVVEVYLYDDRDAGWDTLLSAAERVYALLQDRRVTGTYPLELVNSVLDQRDPTLGDACMLRFDYAVRWRKTP